MGLKRDSKNKNNIYVNKCKCGNKGVAEKKILEEFWDRYSLMETQFKDALEKISTSPVLENKEMLIKSLHEIEINMEKLQLKLSKIRNAYVDGVFSKEEYLIDKESTEKEISFQMNLKNEFTYKLKTFDTQSQLNDIEQKLKWVKDINKYANRYEGKMFLKGKDIRNTPIPKVDSKDIPEVNRILKLIIEKIQYLHYNEETILYSDGTTDTEYGNHIRVTINSR
jgi:site-specific DNA recombinase